MTRDELLTQVQVRTGRDPSVLYGPVNAMCREIRAAIFILHERIEALEDATTEPVLNIEMSEIDRASLRSMIAKSAKNAQRPVGDPSLRQYRRETYADIARIRVLLDIGVAENEWCSVGTALNQINQLLKKLEGQI